MSVASTRPAGPTRPASQLGTDGPPAPTSQHRHPVADSEVVDVPERRGVEDHREGIEPCPCLGLLVVKEVAVLARHVPMMPGAAPLGASGCLWVAGA